MSRSFIALLLLMLAIWPLPGHASTSEQAELSAGGSAAVPTIEQLKSRSDEVEAATDLADNDKATLADLYRKAISSLEQAAGYRETALNYTAIIEDGAAEAERIRAELGRAADKAEATETPIDIDLPLLEIEAQLQKLKADLTLTETNFAEFENQLKSEKERPAMIRQRLTDAKRLLAELSSTLSKPTTAEPATEMSEARRWVDVSLREQLRTEVLMLEQELSSQPTRLILLEAKRDLAELNLSNLRQRVGELEDAANRIRLQEAETARAEAQAAELEATSKHPLVAQLAASNTQLSEESNRLASEIEGINQEKTEAAVRAQQMETDFDTAKQKLEIAGLSQVLGQVLQQERRALPDIRHFRKQANDRESRIAETLLAQIQLEQERRQLRNLPAYIETLSAQTSTAELEEIAPELRTLASSRLELITKALRVQRAYLQAMGELDIAQRRLQDAVERYASFLDRRLLWIRSTEQVGLDTLGLIPQQVMQVLAPGRWQELLKTLAAEVLPSVPFAFALIFSIVVLVSRHRLWGMVQQCGVNVGNLRLDRLTDTLRAIILILLLASPGPLLMLVVGWGLRTSFEAVAFTTLVGKTLILLAPLLFQLHALNLFLAPGSVARVHFGWHESGVTRLHQDLAWFKPLVIGLALVVTLVLLDRELGSGSGLGRALFLAVMAVFGVFFYRLAKPAGGTLSTFALEDRNSVVLRLRYLWFVLLVGPPVASAIVSLAGYMYTAVTLIDHILQSTWFILLVIIIHQLILRWLTLNQRRLRLEAAQAKRRADREAREARDAQDDIEGISMHEIEEPEIDLKALDATSRQLLNNALLLAGLIGLWAIWRDVLPALQVLNDVTLWSYTRTGDNQIVPITLSSLALAIVVIIVTVIATRQLPAFLEIIMLQRLNMTQGSRYTIITLTRYTVIAIGVAWIFGFLGGSWSEVQWIFAALGVGIGFGLQEIVANFISGLIILFERPIRVGDVVTVGNTDGVVTRIQIRATTIRNFDRKELLVPNKNFITQELLNWSLSDQTTRIMIRVGVAYGSNAERALLIMEEVAREHTRVMHDPAPFCVFEEFGDNALLLSLRCYIDDIDYRLRTITDLNLAINERFADAGIEISFPQRDVHLDTRHPLDIRLQRIPPDAD